MPDYQVICCDVDGTLLTDEKTITPENKKWIQKVVNEKGIKFVIVSGRMVFDVRKFYRELEIKSPASCCNGTCLYDENDVLLTDVRMDKNIVKKIIQITDKSNLGMVYIVGDKWYVQDRENYAYQKKHQLYSKDCLVENFTDLLEKSIPNKVVVMDEDKNILNSFKQVLAQNGITDSDVFFYEGKNFIEIMPYGADKSLALESLSKAYNIPLSQIIAIGDDYNDMKMLEKAGLGIAMANAMPEVKKTADTITTSNQESGVASAIRKIFFNCED